MSAPLVAITGAAGFIGSAFCERASSQGRAVRTFSRAPLPEHSDGVVVDLAQAGSAALAQALAGAATIVHLAGRAHVRGETGAQFDALYRDANEAATRRLAEAALAAGVRRFIFASTVKVNGEATAPGRPFRNVDAPAPRDAYARSKLAAEAALFETAAGTSMDVVVLRLPLVYGRGARGNFRMLVDAVRRRRLLPIGAIANRRALLGIDNLLDAIDAAIDAPAPRGVHFVADADSVSTPQLVRAIAAALHVEPRIASVPVPLLRLVGTLVGRRDAIARLTGSLEVDASSLAAATRWKPRPFVIDAAMVEP
jgi:nucleoside-diphosphate-sugar epimerase